MANVLAWLTGRSDNTEAPPPVQVQPELRAYNPTPSEQVGSWIQDLLMAGGAQPYPAGHIAHGVRDLLQMTPLGIGMSAADLLHAKAAGDPAGAAAAAIGMIPAAKPEIQAIRQGIRAFHGSPYDFDRFDISKIGTGEGAQAYGHGLYFAENEGVARQYREQLSAARMLPSDILEQYFKPGEIVKGYGGYDLVKKYDPASRTVTVRSVDKEGNPTQDLLGLRDRQHSTEPTLAQVNEAFARRGLPEYKPGRMYEVNINARPEQFLDWDKPLRDQPHVQDVLADRMLDELPNAGIRNIRRVNEEVDTAGYKSGDILYHMFSRNPREASQILNEAGIPGIRYLDQGSRPSGEAWRLIDKYGTQEKALEIAQERLKNASTGDLRYWDNIVQQLQKPSTSNYVLFNDKLIDILRKYGIAGAAGTGALAGGESWSPSEASATPVQKPQMVQPQALSDKINEILDGLNYQDSWRQYMRLPLQNYTERRKAK